MEWREGECCTSFAWAGPAWAEGGCGLGDVGDGGHGGGMVACVGGCGHRAVARSHRLRVRPFKEDGVGVAAPSEARECHVALVTCPLPQTMR